MVPEPFASIPSSINHPYKYSCGPFLHVVFVGLVCDCWCGLPTSSASLSRMRLGVTCFRLQLFSFLVASSVGHLGLPPTNSFCTMVSNTSRLPVVFVSHGGGPSFFMESSPGDRFSDISAGSEAMKSLQRLPKQLGAEKPKAIVVVSAHWEGYDNNSTTYTIFLLSRRFSYHC